MGKYFGTDGFRGEASEKLKTSHAFDIGRYLGWYFKRENAPARILIGKDTRRSSYMLEYALASGLCASGANPHMMHVTTTPSIAKITCTEDFDCGIMISASHNPFCDNGIKLFSASGEKMGEDVIAKIEDYLEKMENSTETLPFAKGAEIGKITDYISGRNRYIAYLLSMAKHSFRGYRVGLDTANGSTYAIARSVFEALGAKVYMLANTPNGTNINEGCGSTNPKNLQRLVLENNLDVGFAFDGDGDRCIAVDEMGEIVDGDAILYLYAKYLSDDSRLSPPKVSTTIMSNFGLYESLKREGISYSTVPVGDKYVYENMQKEDLQLGGEPSGHTIFRKYATTGDGILSAMKVMQVVIEKKSTLSAILGGYTPYPQSLVNIKVKDKTAVEKDEGVANLIARLQREIKGRILLRASGTENVVRILCECESQSESDKITHFIFEEIKRRGHFYD